MEDDSVGEEEEDEGDSSAYESEEESEVPQYKGVRLKRETFATIMCVCPPIRYCCFCVCWAEISPPEVEQIKH